MRCRESELRMVNDECIAFLSSRITCVSGHLALEF